MRLQQIARYAVKSMRGEALPAATLTLQGLDEDRRYAFVQAASRSSFPWLTARELPEMLRFGTIVKQAGTPEVSVSVTTPGGATWAVNSEELRRDLEERSGRPLFLLRDARGSYDVAPISIISRQTVGRIAEESGTEEDPWRFRPNLLVDLEGGRPFDELSWVGRIVRIGNARIAITQVDQRCVIITLDPATTNASPAILKCVVQQHDKCAGVYGTVITPGEVRAGDSLKIES
jgi:hypothetical protein